MFSLSNSTALVPNAGSNHVYLICVFIRYNSCLLGKVKYCELLLCYCEYFLKEFRPSANTDKIHKTCIAIKRPKKKGNKLKPTVLILINDFALINPQCLFSKLTLYSFSGCGSSLKWDLLLKERICSLRSKFFPL